MIFYCFDYFDYFTSFDYFDCFDYYFDHCNDDGDCVCGGCCFARSFVRVYVCVCLC